MQRPRRVPPSPITVARRAWKRLRTMRSAIILLLLVAAGSAVGSLFPQRPIQPDKVEVWKRLNRGWAPIAEKLGLFDVFGSWWYMALYGLLLVSLVGCLIPRYRAFWRVVRARPRHNASLESQQQYHAGTVALDPEQALRGAERVLRAKRFRLERREGTVSAEKGHWREGGSIVFHTAFLVLLLGMSAGKLFGSTGQVAVIEGERFTDTHVDYDFISEGRYFNERHRGFQIALDSFDVDWHPNGVPKQFISNVRLIDDDRVVRGDRIVVNSPLTYEGVRVYQLSWGWAPHLTVRQRGKVLYDGPTIFLSEKGGWHGVVKLPSAQPSQLGLDMLLFTDPQIGDDGAPHDASPRPNHPVIVYQTFTGDLGLDVPQSVYSLDVSKMTPGSNGVLPAGDTADLGEGIEVSFGPLKQYSVFQVATNPGAVILLIAAIAILVALMPALYSSRRRVWVRAAPEEGRARLEIAGHALQRKAAFEEEFKALVRDLDRDLSKIGSDQ
jgi:cytochrome c biogenesis protein